MTGSGPYFALTMDDPFCISFCSAVTLYFGTFPQIEDYMSALRAGKRGYEETLGAFDQYLAGDTNAEHFAGDHKVRLFRPSERLAYERADLDPAVWEFSNLYGCPYQMKTDGAQVERAVFRVEDRYYHSLTASMRGLCYESLRRAETGGLEPCWQPLRGGFWGTPEFFRVSGGPDSFLVESRLFKTSMEFDSREEAMTAFRDPAGRSLDCMCQEIFGDG